MNPLTDDFARADEAVQILKTTFENLDREIEALSDPIHQLQARVRWKRLINDLAELAVEAIERTGL